MRDSESCPVCGCPIFSRLIDFGLLPRSGIFPSVPQDDVTLYPLSFEYCSNCALIRQRLFNPDCVDYSEISRSTCNQLPDYLDVIVHELKNYKCEKKGLVIEIGGNDGSFLDLIRTAGYDHRLNIEPSFAMAEQSRKKGHPTESVHLNRSQATVLKEKYGLADVVVCRHVIEHVPDPRSLLGAIQILMKDDSVLFLETPNGYDILYQNLGHELWDEHIFYFSQKTLVHMMESNGLLSMKTEIRDHRGGSNILIWGKIGCSISRSLDCVKEDIQACIDFEKRWKDFKYKIQTCSLKWPKPLVCIGASHPQTNFLLYTGIGDHIDWMIDDDPLKIGRYVYVHKAIPILSTTQFLTRISAGTILRTAFGCNTWMDLICSSLNSSNVRWIDPYQLA